MKPLLLQTRPRRRSRPRYELPFVLINGKSLQTRRLGGQSLHPRPAGFCPERHYMSGDGISVLPMSVLLFLSGHALPSCGYCRVMRVVLVPGAEVRSKCRGQNTKRSGNSIIVTMMVMFKTLTQGQKSTCIYIHMGCSCFVWLAAGSWYPSAAAICRRSVSIPCVPSQFRRSQKKHTGHDIAGNKSTASSIRIFRVHYITIDFPYLFRVCNVEKNLLYVHDFLTRF